MKVIQLKREEYDNQGSRLSMLILKSYVIEGALCHTTLTHNVIVLMTAFIAFHILHYFGTNSTIRKEICSMVCEKAHCPFQKSIIKAAGQILAKHKWDASPSPSIPILPSHSSTGYKSACVALRSESWMFHLQKGWS